MMLAARGWLAGALLCALVAAPGCDGDPASGADAGSAGTGPDPSMAYVEIGQGEQAFAHLSRNETLPLAAGTQGGHHVYVGFRMRGLDPSRVLVKVRTTVVGHPELDLDRSGRVNFMPEAAAGEGDADAGDAPAMSGDYIYVGWPAQILAAPMHEGEHAEIAVMLEDRIGRTASADQRIVIGSL